MHRRLSKIILIPCLLLTFALPILQSATASAAVPVNNGASSVSSSGQTSLINLLGYISENCTGLLVSGDSVANNCNNYQTDLATVAGCDTSLFTATGAGRGADEDFTPNTSNISSCTTNIDNGYGIYQTANPLLTSFLSDCKKLPSKNSQWQDCQNKYQNPLNAALGCDLKMVDNTTVGGHGGVNEDWTGEDKNGSCQKTIDGILNVAAQNDCQNANYSGSDLTACEQGYVAQAQGSSNPCNGQSGNAEAACQQGVNDASSASDNSSPQSSPGSSTVTCESDGDPLDWILCPVFNGIANLSQWIFNNIVQPWLSTQPITTNPTDPLFKAWSHFRTYGDIFLVIALLVIVFGQSIGGGLVDAYTAKKILPRLVLAAVLINISIYLVAALVDISNIVGGSLGAVMTAPFSSSGAFIIHPSGIQAGKIIGLSLTGATAAFGAGLIGVLLHGASGIVGWLALFVILPMVFGVIAVFITLVIRKGVILALVLVSPVAFALYCLPNTEGVFRRWWSLLLEMLMIYPIVVMIFAVSDILSVTISSSSGSGTAIAPIVSFVLQFLPLMFIPYAFRLAGGTLARAHELVTTNHKRLQEGIKGNPNDANSLRNKVKRRTGAALTAEQARMLNDAKGPNATSGQRRRARLVNLVDGRVNERQSRYQDEANKLRDMISATGNDDDTYAASWFSVPHGATIPEGLTDGNGAQIAPGGVNTGSDLFFDSKGRQKSESYVKASEAKANRNQHEAGASLEYPVRKIQTDTDVANWRRAFSSTALRQGWSEGEMQGVLASAAFSHKDIAPELYYEKPHMVTDKATGQKSVEWDNSSDTTPAGIKARNGAVGELHKTRESFRLSPLRDGTLRAWNVDRTRIQNELDTPGTHISEEDAQFYAMTNEILDSMVNRGIVTRDGDAGPEMSSSGGSAASAGVLKALMKNRKYETTAARTGAVVAGAPEASTNQRVIYKSEPVDTAISANRAAIEAAKKAGTAPPAPLDRDTVIQATAIKDTAGNIRTVAVTGDEDRAIIR